MNDPRDPREPEENRLPLMGVILVFLPLAIWLYCLFVVWFIGD